MTTTPSQKLPKRMRLIEERFSEPIDQLMRRLYYDEGLSLAELGERLGVPAGTIAGWMIRLGINQRALAEQAAKALVQLANEQAAKELTA